MYYIATLIFNLVYFVFKCKKYEKTLKLNAEVYEEADYIFRQYFTNINA